MPKRVMAVPAFPPIPDLDADEYYYTPEGFVVFTETYHRKRGYCCRSGCRHCPYGFKKKQTRLADTE